MEPWSLLLTGGRSAVLALIGVSVALGLSPGPASVYVAAHTLRDGRASGVIAVAGLCVGTLLTCLVSSVAVTSPILATPDVQWVVRKVAAAYLLVLAVILARRQIRGDGNATIAAKRGAMIFFGGCLLNVVNPYQYSFYVLILPTVVSSAGGTLDGRAVLQGGLIYSTVVSVIYVALTLAIDRLRRFATMRPRTARGLTAFPVVLLAAAAAYLGVCDVLP